MTASTRQQLPPLAPIETAKGFVEKSQPYAAFQQCAPKADTLPFPARNQTTTFS
jgi:hypothetical protein